MFEYREEHDCCEECKWCDCDPCKEAMREIEGRAKPPYELGDILGLFPNTTDLNIYWKATDNDDRIRYINNSGDQLQHLKRLDISIPPGSASFQAVHVHNIINHFHMPVLESITVDFRGSDEPSGSDIHQGRGMAADLGTIYEALCGIESPRLQHVAVRSRMPIRAGGFSEAWVSTRAIVAHTF